MSEFDWIYGQHAVSLALKTRSHMIVEAWVQQGRDTKAHIQLQSAAAKYGFKLNLCERKQLDKLAGENARHQGIIIRCKYDNEKLTDVQSLYRLHSDNLLVVAIDSVTDPHNLGAIMRSTEAAGAHGVIIPKSRGASITPIVRKVSSGASETLKMIVANNLVQVLQQAHDLGIRIIGLSEHANDFIYDVDLRGPIVLVVGSEGEGLRQLTRKTCESLVKIPVLSEHISSLNVSVAAGIALFECVRQRR